MTEKNLARLNHLLDAQITNFESNNLLSLQDRSHLSVIIGNLCSAVTSLTFAMKSMEGDEGEGWND